MRKTSFLILRISCLVCLTWVNSSCAESTPETKTKVSPETHSNPIADTKTELQAHDKKTTPDQHTETFDQFYEQFTNAVDNNDWDKVVSLTQFPFVFKGQLDIEGEIEVSKEEFKKVFPVYLENEAYIDLEGELIPSTFRGLLMTRMDSSESVSDSSAQIHDFVFEKIGNSWKLVKVYTDLSLIN
ncbi:hypothetical protein TDB9533_03008 [Thalassocella blandensis]|nr:hypothetical protein TDB9533_03008 [Thalassocella blandensis]